MSAPSGAVRRGARVDVEILVDGRAFWDRLHQDILGARERVWTQTFSFEGAAGHALADALSACAARDRRILVDSFARAMVGDRLVHAPWNLIDRGFRRCVTDSRALIERTRRAGVAVRFGRPFGAGLQGVTARDHKKIIIADGVAYVGGINFSDHNFAWHDMMVRIEAHAVADTLAEDFAASWDGGASLRRAHFGSLELMSLDGIRNASAVDSLLARIRAARLSVEVISPYLTDPFLNALIEARRSGARVTIVTPAGNNRGFMTRHVVDRGLRGGCDVRLREGMSHLKALLIDGTHLVVGSSNFDWLTYTRQREILAIIEDRRVIRRFRAQVLEPDLRRSRPAHFIGRIPGCLAAIQLAAVRRLAGDPAT